MQTTVGQSTPVPQDTRRQKVIYWLVTAPVLLETAAGIQWDFARNPTVVQVLDTIGFPDYFADVLGVAKCLALAALIVPGFARLKEWAYAGLSFVYFGAAACHLLVDDTVAAILTPLVLGVLGLASWALRPPSRREPARYRPFGRRGAVYGSHDAFAPSCFAVWLIMFRRRPRLQDGPGFLRAGLLGQGPRNLAAMMTRRSLTAMSS